MAIAQNIMTPKPISVPVSTPILDAVSILKKHNITSAPVVGGSGDIIGQITEMGLVRCIVMHQLQPDKFKLLAHCQQYLEPEYSIRPTDTMATLLKAMVDSDYHRVIVKNAADQVVGIISPKDLIRSLLGEDQVARATIHTEMQRLDQET